MQFYLKSLNETVNCDAQAHLNGVDPLIYGFGIDTIVKDDSIRYWMYPRVLNTSMYQNHNVVLNETGKPLVNLCLYYSEKFVDHGIRVTDLKCYKSLVKHFEAIKYENVVEIESDLLVKPSVSLIGEILIVESSMEKRRGGGFGGGFGRGFGRGFGGGFGRGFGGGFGRGFGGFGFGGLGTLALLGAFGGFGPFGFGGFAPGFGFGGFVPPFLG